MNLKQNVFYETLIPPKRPFFEKYDLDILPLPLQMTLTFVQADVYR